MTKLKDKMTKQLLRVFKAYRNLPFTNILKILTKFTTHNHNQVNNSLIE